MSISTLFQLGLITACVSFLIPSVVSAEYGKGTIEDPVTREYTRGAYKDWQEGIILHTPTGNYIVTYKTVQEYFNAVIFEPATKIDPTLKSKYKIKNDGGTISYVYKLKSKSTSKQPISSMRTVVSIETPALMLTTLPAPNGWLGSLSLVAPGAGSRLGWRYRQLGDKLGGLDPGKSVEGFELEVTDLPGISVMQIRGASQPPTWLGHAPDLESPVGKQVSQLEDNDFVPRLAAVPKIVVPIPFDAAIVLSGIQKHIKDDLFGMKLIDPVLASQLDRLLQAAIDAAKLNNTAALRSNLKDARKLLKKEHEDMDSENDKDFDKDDANETKKSALIDRLAAKVLDFDLKYVEKRVKEDKD